MPLTEQKAVRLYREGRSSVSIGREYGIPASTICSWVKKYSGSLRSLSVSHRRHTLDETAFDVLTPEALYWVGMLLTDGSVVKDKRGKNPAPKICLSLTASDREHVEKLKTFLKSSAPISELVDRRRPTRTARLVVTSHKLARRLSELGIAPRKTRSARAVKSVSESRDFWRGCIDGDGCLILRKDGGHSLNLCGTEFLCKQFQKFCETHSCTAYVRAHSSKPYVFYTLLHGPNCRRILRILYAGARTYLERKGKKAMEFLGETVCH